MQSCRSPIGVQCARVQDRIQMDIVVGGRTASAVGRGGLGASRLRHWLSLPRLLYLLLLGLLAVTVSRPRSRWQARGHVPAEFTTNVPLANGTQVQIAYALEGASSAVQALSLCGLLPEGEGPWGEDCVQNVAEDILESKLFRYYALAKQHDMQVLHDVLSSGYDVDAYEPNGDGQFGEGTSMWFPDKIRDLARLIEQEHVSTYCEVGFNGGHSAVLAAALKPDITIWAFDLATHLSAPRAVTALQKNFPKAEVHVTIGNSLQSLPALRQYLDRTEAGLGCDVIFVDGGHTHDVAFSDLAYLASMSRRRGEDEDEDEDSPLPAVMMDDVDWPAVRKAWDRATDEGWLRPMHHRNSTYSECPLLQQNPTTLRVRLLEGMECSPEDRVLWRNPRGRVPWTSTHAIGQFVAEPPATTLSDLAMAATAAAEAAAAEAEAAALDPAAQPDSTEAAEAEITGEESPGDASER